jgi:membrane associated rhomboid family serine protease
MADDPERPRGRDWTERVARIAGALGFNETRVRWKLQIWRGKWTRTRRRTDQTRRHITYAHKVCPRCGQLNDQDERACTSCGQALAGRRMEVLHRLGLSVPRVVSVSGLLGLALVLVYARLIAAEWPHAGILSVSAKTLVLHGGHWTPAVQQGQYWRWLTCVFLHAGLWHIGFNLFALSQIGPAVEEVFGRGRMLLLFIVTGLCGSVGSYLWGMDGVGIGASGAVMGLCGVAAGWGHRDGTGVGRAIRGMMLKWAVYTVLFGFFIGADNAAHVAGFVSGGVIGYALHPMMLRRTQRRGVAVLQGLLGGGATLAAVVLCLFPPALPEAVVPGRSAGQNPYVAFVEACRLVDQGRTEDALKKLRAAAPGAPHTAQTLGQTCAAIQKMEAQCRRGFDDLGGQAVRQMEVYCRMLREARAGGR